MANGAKNGHAISLPDSSVLGTTIHEFACHDRALPVETRGWSDEVRP
jgi:hypothetical protein